MSSQASSINLEVGSAFAGYRIDEVLDAPSNEGAVYVATHLESERLLEFPPWPVALKLFSPELLSDAARLREFVERARLQSHLRHPNVVSIYEVGTSPAPFISMTLFRGPNLADLIAEGELDDESALAAIAGVGSALEAGLRKGLAYRGLRPAGVLVAAGEPRRAFVGDFGAARAEDPEDDPTAGVRALGAMLFESLTGEAPDPETRSLSELRPELPAGLDGVLRKALSANPRRRQRTPGEFVDAVERAMNGRGGKPRLRSRSAAAAPAAAAPAADAPAESDRPEPPTDAGEEATEEQPAEQEARGRRVLSPVALGAALLLVAAAAALGLLLAPDEEPEVRLTQGDAVATESFGLRRPADWQRARAPRIPGLVLSGPVALTPAGAGPGARERVLVAGDLKAGPGGVLPTGLVSALPRQPSREPVELGSVQAYRYRGLRPRSFSGQLNLYVVPTTADAVVVGCLAPAARDAFLGDCERVASTLALKGAGAIPLATSQRYARGLSGIVSRLNAARTAQRRALRRARTRGAQAAASRRLGDAYARARRSAAALAPPAGGRQLHAYIVRHLGRAATGYRRMAVSARAARSSRWNSARRAAISSEQAVQSGIRALRPLGYVPARPG